MSGQQLRKDMQVGDQLMASDFSDVGNCPFCGNDDNEAEELEIDWEGGGERAYRWYHCKACGAGWELAFAYVHLTIVDLPEKRLEQRGSKNA